MAIDFASFEDGCLFDSHENCAEMDRLLTDRDMKRDFDCEEARNRVDLGWKLDPQGVALRVSSYDLFPFEDCGRALPLRDLSEGGLVQVWNSYDSARVLLQPCKGVNGNHDAIEDLAHFIGKVDVPVRIDGRTRGGAPLCRTQTVLGGDADAMKAIASCTSSAGWFEYSPKRNCRFPPSDAV